MADVNRAVERATNDALAASAAIFLTVLCDKESADAEIILFCNLPISTVYLLISAGSLDLFCNSVKFSISC